MIDEEQKRIYLLLEMSEAAIEELKSQGENLIELQKSAQAAILATTEKERKSLNRFILALNLKFFVLACLTVFCTVLAIISASHANVWWETSKLKTLAEQKAQMEENIEQLGKLKGHMKLSTCGKDKRPCVEVDAKDIYEDSSHSFYILKGVK